MSTIFVSSAAELIAGLKAAKSGDVFQLSPGDYDTVTISNFTPIGPVTITSRDASHVAHFDMLKIVGSTNLIIDNVNVGSPSGSDPAWGSYASLQITRSGNVTVRNSAIEGSADSDFTNDRVGMYISDSNNINVGKNDFNNLTAGIIAARTDIVSVYGNVFEDIRVDATQFTQVNEVTISGNEFKSFHKGPLDHSDAIQFFTANTTSPSSNIVIYDNIIMQGDGNGMQGIFMRDEVGTLPFENVKILNNLIYQNSEYNGIAVQGGSNVYVSGNTVLSRVGDNYDLWIRLENVSSGEVTNNISDAFIFKSNGPGLIAENNVNLKQNPELAIKVPNINADAFAHAGDLTVPSVGYQNSKGVGSAMAEALMSFITDAKSSMSINDDVLRDSSSGRLDIGQVMGSGAEPAVFEQHGAMELPAGINSSEDFSSQFIGMSVFAHDHASPYLGSWVALP